MRVMEINIFVAKMMGAFLTDKIKLVVYIETMNENSNSKRLFNCVSMFKTYHTYCLVYCTSKYLVVSWYLVVSRFLVYFLGVSD